MLSNRFLEVAHKYDTDGNLECSLGPFWCENVDCRALEGIFKIEILSDINEATTERLSVYRTLHKASCWAESTVSATSFGKDIYSCLVAWIG